MSLKSTNKVDTNKVELEIEISAEAFENYITRNYQNQATNTYIAKLDKTLKITIKRAQIETQKINDAQGFSK